MMVHWRKRRGPKTDNLGKATGRDKEEMYRGRRCQRILDSSYNWDPGNRGEYMARKLDLEV